MVDQDDYGTLCRYPTVRRIGDRINCFEVPAEAKMTEELVAVVHCSGNIDKDLRARWADKLKKGFATGENLAMETLKIAARHRSDGYWALGTMLRAAVEAEQDDFVKYIARGFICTIVRSAVSGRSPLAKRMRHGESSESPSAESGNAKPL